MKNKCDSYFKRVLLDTNIVVFLSIIIMTTGSFGTVLSSKSQIKRSINSDIAFYMDARVDYNQDHISYHHYSFGSYYRLSKTVTAGLFYRTVFQFKDDEWTTEHRPYAQLENKYGWSGIQIRLRDRIDYRIRDTDYQLRNRIRIMIQSKQTYGSVKPFISNEWFFLLTDHKYTKNWFISGILLPKISGVRSRLYYKNVATKIKNGHGWKAPVHMITLSLAF